MKHQYASKKSQDFYFKLAENMSEFPVKMNYNGKVYNGFPEPDFIVTDRIRNTNNNKINDIVTLSGLENITVIVKMSYWKDYGVLEWTVEFENRGNENTAELSDLFCCNLNFEGDNPILRGILGDHVNYYRPYNILLENEPVYFESLSGRPTHVNFPYFNLEYGNEGVMFAIGWSGTWSADFKTENNITSFKARSTVGLSLYLKPGEKIRTALMVVAPYYVRDETYATNFWRSWFINCNMPKADAAGNPVKPFSTCCLAHDTGLPNSDGSISERYTTWKPSLDKMFEENIHIDFRWFDAGWYSDPEGNTVESDWSGTIGSWELDKVKWPGDTFKESVDYGLKHGMKTLMWFEPERVTNPEALERNYGYNAEWTIKLPESNYYTNNIGNPDCLKWTTERICRVLKHNNVAMYREDNNRDPQALWNYMDKVDGRYGISEINMITAHYKMWDDILDVTKSYGGCAFCDSCASGGGRNDIESLRRGIPLLRSDSDRRTTARRLSMTTSFNRWIPFTGANSREKTHPHNATGVSDKYTWRASYLPVLNVDAQFVYEPTQNFDIMRFGLEEWKRVNPYLLADFYILTPWHEVDQKDEFTAFSYYDPEKEKGVLLIFRMEECEKEIFNLVLPYASDKDFILVDADNDEKLHYRKNMSFDLKEKRTAKLYFVEKV